MPRRNRRGLNKIGALALAMLLALGAMGTAYGAWVEEIYINSTVYIGSTDAGLTCGSCWEEPDTPDTDIDCTASAPMTLTIEVKDAVEGVHYYCSFIVKNTGSLPIKIKTMDLTGSYPGVTAVFDDLTGTVIDPNETATGEVHIYLTTDEQVDEDLAFTLSVSVVLWNEA